jgi:hypothetical protein
MKQRLLVGSENSFTESLNQALKLEATSKTVILPGRLQDVRVGAPVEICLPGPRTTGQADMKYTTTNKSNIQHTMTSSNIYQYYSVMKLWVG